ncbi:hypothetical protein D8Y20_02090 [Mariprofundus sp. EBB-1]|uniref:CdaR family protein n=1 Tax=Mariprofundus sp. EBB-1 TaxID=2650971 RepID=UPI000EF20A85|nr:CdaR family protein [Mariprofundus sp. EBB-1]RLL55008.1 hypothetical protein D8Y20_02090 [Mariprofundus sp. EBB-1]
MAKSLALFRRYNLHFWAIAIALSLWLHVHGQGEGSVSMDVPLQVHGLPADMVIVNDFPDHVRVSINGLQSRLKDLRERNLSIPINASDLTTPGVVERAPQLSAVSLPVGLHIDKVQPDRLQLQVDRLVTRSIPIKASFELPEGWYVDDINIKPQQVKLTGPEVWLEPLREVDTAPIRLTLKEGAFKTSTGIESPSGKAIRLTDNNTEIIIQGTLLKKSIRPTPATVPGDPL